MDKQNFLSATFNGRFPISANTFEFMQNSIEFVSQLASVFGNNVLLKRATGTKNGLIVLGGELLPLQANSSNGNYYQIIENSETVTAQGIEFAGARITRVAQRSSQQTPFPVSSVVDLTGRSENSETLANQFLPKGAIIMWSGSWSNIPKGFALCNGNNGDAINGVTIPDLRGRFIVGGKSGDDDFGTENGTGGSKTHTLTIDEMPSHNHNVSVPNRGAKNIKGGSDDHWHVDNSNNVTSTNTGGGQPFKHLPPYYVLAFIIKVI